MGQDKADILPGTLDLLVLKTGFQGFVTSESRHALSGAAAPRAEGMDQVQVGGV
jgi:hypothetical protein